MNEFDPTYSGQNEPLLDNDVMGVKYRAVRYQIGQLLEHPELFGDSSISDKVKKIVGEIKKEHLMPDDITDEYLDKYFYEKRGGK